VTDLSYPPTDPPCHPDDPSCHPDDPSCHPDEVRISDSTKYVLDPTDAAIVEAQLGRTPRGAVQVAWRCPCGKPGVVKTAPRLPDGTPFPTTYYLTCPNAVKACSTLEGSGWMAAMTRRLGADPDLARRYGDAHRSYIADRQALGVRLGQDVPEISGVSAGGMPDRVKCVHALLAQALAKGPGVNPVGDEALGIVGEFWKTPCQPRVLLPEAGSLKPCQGSPAQTNEEKQ